MSEKNENLPQKLNFFSTAFISIMGFALAAEIFQEDDFLDKIDDILLLVLGVVAIIWYRKNANKKTLAPVWFLAIGAVVKFAAMVIEHKDASALGDDIGVFVALVIGLCVAVYQYRKLK